MVSFRFGEEEGINRNRGMQEAPQVLRKLLASDEPVSAELCTEALRRELRLDPTSESLLAKIAAAESLMDFPGVEEKFRIISADTRTVLVDEDVIRRIENFEPVDWREIQRKSVQIWAYRIDELRMPQLERHPGVYKWHLAYSPFLGYMEGILDDAEFRRNGGGVL